jgi:hypothetical protein
MNNSEPLVRLSEALRMLKADPLTAWMPRSSLRAAVQEGKVPFQRSSDKKRAWYYVRLSDLKKVIVSNR